VTREEARAQALAALYAAESTGADVPDVSDLPGRARRLAAAVWEHRAGLDRRIGEVASGWRIERMPAVDRNILRIGTFELLHTDTPVGVIVSEAVKMAKRFSTSRSGRFVNGVLGRIAVDVRGGEGDSG